MFLELSKAAMYLVSEYDWLAQQTTTEFEDDLDSRSAVVIMLSILHPMKTAIYLTLACDYWNKAHGEVMQ